MPALPLNANSSAVTAIGNDCGYKEVFARKLTPGRGTGRSVSVPQDNRRASFGRSYVQDASPFTIALTGASGGRPRQLS